MAWIQMDTDLETKPEYTRLRRHTKVSKAELTRRIFHLWCWIDQSTTDGFYPGYDAHDLEDQFEGTTAEFWQCFAKEDVQWLEFTDDGMKIPGYEKRFSQSAKRRARQSKWVAGKRKGKPEDEAQKECRQNVDVDVDLNQIRSDQNKSDTSDQSSDRADGSGGKKTWSKAQHDVTLESISEVAGELFLISKYDGEDGTPFVCSHSFDHRFRFR